MAHTRFRALAVAVAPVALAGAIVTAAAVAGAGGRTYVAGWQPERAGDGFIARVDPDGPAAGTLADGDRLVAVDGVRVDHGLDPRVVRQFLRGSSYAITVRRHDADVVLRVNLATVVRPQQSYLARLLLLVGIVWCSIATLIAVLRPDQPSARSAYAAGMSVGLFFVVNSLQPIAPFVAHWQRTLSWALFPLAPLHLALGYDFYQRFPNNDAPTRAWRAVRSTLFMLCALLALWSLADFAAFAIDERTQLAFRLASAAAVSSTRDYAMAAVLVAAALAIIAVLARNYRTIADPDARRRLTWVVWGTALAVAPLIVASLLVAVELARPGRGPITLPWYVNANLATVMIPLSFGYAIIRHRVFDITVVVRRGLQYLLAKNALRVLLFLPVAGLLAGVAMHPDQSVGSLLRTNSVYLYLIGAALVSLKFRAQLSRWVDRRFFREAYDRERILLGLISEVDRLDSASSVSKLVSHELELAFHPICLFVWYRESTAANLTLAYSSGGYIHSPQLSIDAPLVRMAERQSGVIELPASDSAELPQADRDWLGEAGVRLIVPMVGADRAIVGLMMLGGKKSEEPYSAADLTLLSAIGRQIAVARENVRLKDRVDQDRRIRHDVLARLETSSVSLLRECPSCGACFGSDKTHCPADGAELLLTLPVESTVDGKYRLDRNIGRGGMGAVYEATDLRLARTVAVKIMLGRGFGDRQALRRFEREAQAAARLAHPNIVTVFDFGAAGADGAYIVMELVHGLTLRQKLERSGRLPPATMAAWFEQICGAVAAAHRRGIVHRDLKPANVLIATSESGTDLVKVVDFGLAKLMSLEPRESGALTDPGVVMGTLGYMAPEQLTGGEVDERTDIFALGVMAAEAFTGKRPFEGATPGDVLLAILQHDFALPGQSAPERRLEAAIKRAIAKDSSARPASVSDFAAELLAPLLDWPVDQTTATSGGAAAPV